MEVNSAFVQTDHAADTAVQDGKMSKWHTIGFICACSTGMGVLLLPQVITECSFTNAYAFLAIAALANVVPMRLYYETLRLIQRERSHAARDEFRSQKIRENGDQHSHDLAVALEHDGESLIERLNVYREGRLFSDEQFKQLRQLAQDIDEQAVYPVYQHAGVWYLEPSATDMHHVVACLTSNSRAARDLTWWFWQLNLFVYQPALWTLLGTTMHDLTGLNAILSKLIFSAVVFPVAMYFKDAAKLNWLVYCGISFAFVMLGSLVVAASTNTDRVDLPEITANPIDLNILGSLPTAMFAFACITMMPALVKQMEDVTQAPSVIGWSVGSLLIVFSGFALLMVLQFGNIHTDMVHLLDTLSSSNDMLWFFRTSGIFCVLLMASQLVLTPVCQFDAIDSAFPLVGVKFYAFRFFVLALGLTLSFISDATALDVSGVCDLLTSVFAPPVGLVIPALAYWQASKRLTNCADVDVENALQAPLLRDDETVDQSGIIARIRDCLPVFNIVWLSFLSSLIMILGVWKAGTAVF